MTAMQMAGAASRRKARRQQMGIVKVEWKRPTGFCKEPLEMLELLEGKLSRAVLRGLGGSNPTWLPGEKTVNELASEYGVHPVQISQWKRAVQDEAPQLLSSRRGRREKEEEELKATLYQQIGQLKVEVDWLKKKGGLVG